MSSLIGRTIDTYEVHSVLGQGGMGIVYLARDTTLDREVALKLMDAGLTRDESFLKRFQSEAKALAKLQNPNIVGIFALRETEEGLCIVMEYVQGNTLADQLREQGTLPIDRTINIFRQLLTAFDHAHSAGIIHRDIKPGNILLTPDDTVKVTDFGLAKIQAVNQATMTMGTGGTLYYMSPEQVRGLANVDQRGDIYSLGMTLYETLTGAVPFESQTDFTIRQAIVEGNIPSPDIYLPTLPKALKQVIMKSIARLPDDRYQTASEMWAALEAATISKPATRIGQQQHERMTSTSIPRKKSRFLTMKIAVSVSLAFVLIAAIYFLLLSGDQFQLSINTLPAGAIVKLNGESYGVTPLRNVNLDEGKNEVSLSLTGYKGVDTTIRLASNTNLELMLVPVQIDAGKGMLNVSSMPTGASVELDGTMIGVTPLAGFTLESRTVQLRVSLNGHVPFDTSLQIADGQTIGLPITLAASTTENPSPSKPVVISNDSRPVSTGTLSIAVVPNGEVTINGETKRADASQPAMFTLPTASVNVSIKHPSYGTQRERATIEAGKTTTLTYRWERRIIIGVIPTFANITINNESIGVATLKDVLKGPGRYTIAVAKPSWEIERIELNGTTVAGGDITVTPGFDDKSYKMKFFLKEKL